MKTFVERWERFWFAPAQTSTLAVLRIAYGILVMAWAAAIIPDVSLFSTAGPVPQQPAAGLRWGVLGWSGSNGVLALVLLALFVAAFCLTIGYRTRLASVVTFVVVMSLIRRDPLAFNSGDAMVRAIGLFLALSPAGAALSVDRLRSNRTQFWSFPLRAPWAVRLIQVQVSMGYLFTVWAKARGTRWIAGTAVAESMRVGDVLRFKIPYALSESLLLANLLTYGTILIELSLAILIWNRRLRPWVIGFGIALHLFIELTFALGFFSLVMITSYIAWVPEDAMTAWLGRVRERLGRSRVSVLRRLAAVGERPPLPGAAIPPGAPVMR